MTRTTTARQESWRVRPTAAPPDKNDWVFIRGTSSSDWIYAYDWGDTNDASYIQGTVAVDDLLSAAGQDYSSTFEVMFRWYDTTSVEGGDGVPFDDLESVALSDTCGPATGTVSGEVVLDRDSMAGTPPIRDCPEASGSKPRTGCVPLWSTARSDRHAGIRYPDRRLLVGPRGRDVEHTGLRRRHPAGLGPLGRHGREQRRRQSEVGDRQASTTTTLNFPFVSEAITLPYLEASRVRAARSTSATATTSSVCPM